MKVELDERKLMNSMDRTRRIGLLMLCVTAIGEGVGLVGIVLHLDFGDPLHRLLLFISILIYFTLGGVQPEYAHLVDAANRHDVYSMVVHGFRNPIVSASYIAAMLVLGVHLQHGAASLFQTLGVNHETYNAMIRVGSLGLVVVIVVANSSIPILVMTGVIPPIPPAGGP